MSAFRRRFGYGAGITPPSFCLKFLVDNALPPRLAHLLESRYYAVHVGAYGMHAATDVEILARALKGIASWSRQVPISA